jgi:hypothetical protein
LARRNKYVGPGSCYALREGVWVKEGVLGVDFITWWGILALIMRDVARGWSYDDECNVIPFTLQDAKARLRFQHALAHKHAEREPEAAELLRELFYESLQLLESGRGLPDYAVVELEGYNAGKLAQELVQRGIVRPHQVKVYTPLALPVG